MLSNRIYPETVESVEGLLRHGGTMYIPVHYHTDFYDKVLCTVDYTIMGSLFLFLIAVFLIISNRAPILYLFLFFICVVLLLVK